MRTWQPYALFLFLVIFAGDLFAQKKIVVMGSSTAAGSNATPGNSWVEKLRNYYNQTAPFDTIVENIAQGGGMDTYREMPTGFVPPAGRPTPIPTINVTKALSLNPQAIIINLPTNDVFYGYTKKEFMDNLRIMFSTIMNAGVKCFITTTQPRTMAWAERDSLRALADSIKNNFGYYSIDFYTDLVNPATLDFLASVSAGDGIHINDLGHNFVYIRARDKNVLAPAGPLPLTLTSFKASLTNKTVKLNWQTEQEEPNTWFDIQRSADGTSYESIGRVTAAGNGLPNSYTWTDNTPLPGRSFYRLKITENGREKFSKIASIENKAGSLVINKLYKENQYTLTAEIGIRKSGTVALNVIDMTGAVVYRQSQFVASPSSVIRVDIGKLQTGQYYLRVIAPDNTQETIGFIK